MDVTFFDIEGVCLITPKVFEDERGTFHEAYRMDALNAVVKTDVAFVQDNHALSKKAGVVRGLHYQAPPHAQAKLVSCIAGAVMDVVVDVRTDSKTYGQHLCVKLTADSAQQLWIPAGFLHGYVSLEDNSEFLYKVTSYYNKPSEGAVRWDDPDLSIEWGIEPVKAIVSDKDSKAMAFSDFVSPF